MIKAILWGVVGFVVTTLLIGGLIGNGWPSLVAGAILGVLAFTSSKKNNGAPPSWLWCSRKQK